jgi:alcohol dehydrogenase
MRLTGGFSYCCPVKIKCGTRALAQLPEELIACNAKAPLILTSREQVDDIRLRAVVDAFGASGLTIGIYDRLSKHPTPDLMPVLARMYRDGGCDSLVAVGGGSVANTAKCLNLIVSSDGQGELAVVNKNTNDPGPLRPLLLVATPGGDGNEISGYAVHGDRRTVFPGLTPAVVFIDPVFMDGNERELVNGALIGLVHAVEALLDTAFLPMRHAFAHTAIGLIMHHLPLALRKIEPRKNLCAVVNGQVAAGCAYHASSPGPCHTLAAHLGETNDLPAGLSMAIILPHLLSEAGAASPERVGRLLYPMAGQETSAMTADALRVPRVVALVWEFFDALNGELAVNIPTTLTDAGMTDKQIDDIRERVAGQSGDETLARIVDRARKGVAMIDDRGEYGKTVPGVTPF